VPALGEKSATLRVADADDAVSMSEALETLLAVVRANSDPDRPERQLRARADLRSLRTEGPVA
jgi:hypothetical protein